MDHGVMDAHSSKPDISKRGISNSFLAMTVMYCFSCQKQQNIASDMQLSQLPVKRKLGVQLSQG